MNINTPPSIVTYIQKEIGYVPYQHIEEFIRSLSPIFLARQSSIFENLFNAILYQYENKPRLLIDTKVEDISMEIVVKASKVNQQFGNRLKNVLNSSEFIQAARRGIEKKKINHSVMELKEKVPINALENRIEQIVQIGKTKSAFNFEVIKGPAQKNQHMNLNKLALTQTKMNQNCKNLVNRPQCLCANEREVVTKDEFSFKCVHCNRLFHTVCMKKKSNSEYCCYCHIERMIPIKRVLKTVYLGIFQRHFRRHIANIFIPDIEPNQKFQVRCLRLKEGAPTSCLFPDIAELTMNGHRVKEFEPINRQSCLKYRKDEPFNLLKGEYYLGQENNLVLSQSMGNLKEKEIRYDSQNHLFGIFVVEDIKIENLIQEIKEKDVLGFSESASILNESFAKFGKGDDELTCQLVKIPLSCPLSTLRIEIPARGKFCNHFQCFDLKNYLTLISESLNPRWNCPLCKNFAYELQIDSIMLQILKNIKNNEKIQQILFFKNGDYTAIIDDEPDKDRKNIRNLNIPEKKAKIIPPMIEDRPARKLFIMPENASIIDLDD